MDETTQTNEQNSTSSSPAKFWGIKTLLIIMALILFQIPIFIVKELSSERKNYYNAVETEITRAWGKKQLVGMSRRAEEEHYTVEVTPQIRCSCNHSWSDDGADR